MYFQQQPVAFPIGTVIPDTTTGNKYTVVKLIGMGSSAKVYEVVITDESAEQQHFACKSIYNPALTFTTRRMLKSEIEIHKSMDHNAIVKFIHHFEDEEQQFTHIILELCSNQSLMQLLKESKKFSEQQTRCFMFQIVDGVKYMHETRNIVHRDFKLGNYFLSRHERAIKIGDFGFAQKFIPATSDEEKENNMKNFVICGTPNYVAPELLLHNATCLRKVDIWALGVVMYTLLVGQAPFQSSDVSTTYRRIKKNQYSFPVISAMSTSAEMLIRDLLSPNPEDRPSLATILSHSFFTQDLENISV